MSKHLGKGFVLAFWIILATVLLACQKTVNVSVTFDSNGGSEVPMMIYDTQFQIHFPEAPTKTGYTFAGWFLDNQTFLSPINEADIKAFKESEQITVYAKWTVRVFSLSFLDHQGIVLHTEQIAYNDDLSTSSVPLAPTRLGHTFIGWDIPFPEKMPANDLILQAQYEKNRYTITYHTMGGDPIQASLILFEDILNLVVPTKEEHHFQGWFLDQAYTIPMTETQMPAQDLVLYAKWEIITYPLIFVVDSVPILTFHFPKGSSLDHVHWPSYPASKRGHTFIGWSQPVPAVMPNSVVRIEALFEKNVYQIDFDSQGGSWIDPHSFLFDDVLVLPIPSLEHYDFMGWYLDPEGKEAFEDVQMPDKDILLYAKWSMTHYPITYHLDEGTNHPDNRMTYTYQTDNFLLKSPERIGYTFLGWFATPDFSGQKLTFVAKGTSGHLEFYAQWDINPYEIEYHVYPYQPSPVLQMLPYEHILKLTTGESHGFILTTHYRLLAFGNNANGRLGDGTTTQRVIPIDIRSSFVLNPQEHIISVFAGKEHSFALTNQNRLFAWGRNHVGQLGDGTLTQRVLPVDITHQFSLGQNETIVEISLGYEHTLVVTSLGRVFTWGRNNYNQLGDGSITTRQSPIEITSAFNLSAGDRIISVSAGDSHSLARSLFGRVFAWGRNNAGQLGLGHTVQQTTPTEMTANFSLLNQEKIVSIKLGELFSIALTNQGRVFTFGNNTSGRLGDGLTLSRSHPFNITPFFELSHQERIVQIETYKDHSFAKTNLGRLFAWGNNSYGKLGDQGTTQQTKPVFIELGAISTMVVGDSHSMVLDIEGRLWVWGRNNLAQLGLGHLDDQHNPIEMIKSYPELIFKTVLDFNAPIEAYNPELRGFSLKAWYEELPLVTPIIYEQMPAKRLILLGLWDINHYPIIYHLDGGTNPISHPNTYTVLDPTLSLLEATKPGYTFLGWSIRENETYLPITEIPSGSIGEIELFAQFVINEYTISFDSTGGTPVHAMTQEYMSSLVAPTHPTKKGYQFAGWYLSEDYLTPFVFDVMPKENITLYAKWVPNVYIVTFVYNNGQPDQVMANYAGYPIPTPTRPDYRFSGWYYDSQLTMPHGDETFPTENTTLYAKWLELYTISYVLDGGTNHPNHPTTVTLADAFELLTPTKEGHSFLGWYLDQEGLEPISSIDSLQGDLTLYALWVINQYTLSYYTHDPDEAHMAHLKLDEKMLWISTGMAQSFAVTSDYRVFAWGRNQQGQLGDGTQINRLVPTEITDNFPLLNQEHVVLIASGDVHSFAITNLNRVFAWGNNTYAKLGTGNTTAFISPIEITSQFSLRPGELIVDIQAGIDFSMALTNQGRVFTWGRNTYGQIGDGSTTQRNIPTDITTGFLLGQNEKVIQISAGHDHAMALTNQGNLYAWGRNTYGQIGNNSMVQQATPLKVTSFVPLGLNDAIIYIQASKEHSGVLSSNGQLFVWGRNQLGQIGNGTTQTSLLPINIMSSFLLRDQEKITLFSMGADHMVAMTNQERIFTWGSNATGQLGIGNTQTMMSPIEITHLIKGQFDRKVYLIRASGNHTVIANQQDALMVWGQNNVGQLGLNNTQNQLTPQRGGFIYPEPITEIQYTFGAFISPFTPFRYGYVFDGWYTDINHLQPAQFEHMPAVDVKLYAKWVKPPQN